MKEVLAKMKKEARLKAMVKGYHPSPFFFREQRGGVRGDTRFVVWTPDLRQLKRVFYDALRKFPNRVEILVKVEDGEKDKQKWERYYRRLSLLKLQEAIKSSEKFVFQDGDSQVSIRRPDTGEYVTLDEHGIFYIYSDSEVFEKLCREAGFEERVEKLVSQSGHWHILPKDADKLKHKFVNQLNLKAIS